VGWASDYDEDYTLTIYRDKGAAKRVRPFRGRVIDMDSKGTIYMVNGKHIETWSSAKKVASFELERICAAT
jgi:hypothetical protein